MIRKYNGAKAERKTSREPIPAGGYVAKILNAEVQNRSFGDMLVLSFDVCEGEMSGFFRRDYAANTNEDKKWRGTYRMNIPKDDGSQKDEWSKQTMNNAIWAIEGSNIGFTWDWNETALKGKLVGVLFRDKQWEYNGKEGWTTECCALDSVENIRAGNFKTPKPKALQKEKTAEKTAFDSSGMFVDFGADNGDLPF